MKIRQDLTVSELGDEIVVFDPKSNQVHNLNAQASSIFRKWQSNSFVAESNDEQLALALFQEKGLLEADSSEPVTTRREALAVLGKVALIPAITSVAMPEPLSAMSGVSEADCVMGVAGSCGMLCLGVITTRRCGADPGTGACGCFAGTPTCPCT